MQSHLYKIRNRRGPTTEPRGTPDNTGIADDDFPSKTTSLRKLTTLGCHLQYTKVLWDNLEEGIANESRQS